MLVIRTKHFWLSSAPARRSGHGIMRVQLLMAQSAERELGMAWLWPERLDIEVPAAVCTAATMGALGRIPVETRIAPKSENWQLSPHRRGVGELCASSRRVFWSSCGRPRHAPTTRLGFPHGNGALPCGNPAGVRWACRLRPGELQNTRCATTAEVKILHWGTASVRKNIAQCGPNSTVIQMVSALWRSRAVSRALW